MTDYGHDLRIGVFVTPDADREPAVLALAELADTLLSHLAYEERELLEPLARHGYR